MNLHRATPEQIRDAQLDAIALAWTAYQSRHGDVLAMLATYDGGAEAGDLLVALLRLNVHLLHCLTERGVTPEQALGAARAAILESA